MVTNWNECECDEDSCPYCYQCGETITEFECRETGLCAVCWKANEEAE